MGVADQVIESRGRLRVFWLMALAAILAAILVFRLLYWQVAEHQHIAAMAADQHQVTFKLPAHRGNILDRNGQLLATDTPVFNVVAAPNLIPADQRPTISGRLAVALGMDQAEVLKQVSQPLKFTYVRRMVPKPTGDRIDAMHLTGIALEPDSQRSYLSSVDAPPTQPGPVVVQPSPLVPPSPSPSPSPGAPPPAPILPHSLASNLLGFVNHDGAGQYGVEQYYDKQLRGTDGFESSLKTGANQTIVLSDQQRQEPRNGVDLQLGIDSQVQFFAEKALAEGVQKTGAESGSVIVMEPSTGNIVAWADYPSFDANSFGATDGKLFTDPIVSGLYEPGSVMKLVTMSGGLDSGAVTPGFSFNETGAVNVGGFTIHDWDNKAHGNTSMTRVIEQSLNVGAVKVQQMEGTDNFLTYLNRFGIGKPTGVDVAGEVSQQLPPKADWHASELATASFGQGVVVTPIEMVDAVNSVATGGRLVKPRLVTSTIDSAGHRSDAAPDPGTQVISSATAGQVRDMMTNVVEHGSGWTAKIPGWTGHVAGKTGTANIPEGGRYTDKVVASFVGFMPAENPRFTMIVIMRKPQGGGFQQEGTFAAAPVWKTIAQQILAQWHITP
jgi:cell division protein FtsI/penicillin-binding protein 2